MKFSKEELEDIASEVGYRLEREYAFYEVNDENDNKVDIYGSCYVTAPAIGDHVLTEKRKLYKVVAVIHPLGSNFAGEVYVKPVNKVTF